MVAELKILGQVGDIGMAGNELFLRSLDPDIVKENVAAICLCETGDDF